MERQERPHPFSEWACLQVCRAWLLRDQQDRQTKTLLERWARLVLMVELPVLPVPQAVRRALPGLPLVRLGLLREA